MSLFHRNKGKKHKKTHATTKHHAVHAAKHHYSARKAHSEHRHTAAHKTQKHNIHHSNKGDTESITFKIKEPKTQVESKILNLEKTTNRKIEQMSQSFDIMKSMLTDLKKENEQLLKDKKFLLQKTKDIILELHRQKILHEKEKEAITRFARRSDAITQFYTTKETEAAALNPQNTSEEVKTEYEESGANSVGAKSGNSEAQPELTEEKQKEISVKKQDVQEVKKEKHHRFGFFHHDKKEGKKGKKEEKKEKKEKVKKLSKKQLRELKNASKKVPKNLEEYEEGISQSEEGKSKIPVSQISIAERGAGQRVETPLDELLELVMKKGSISTAVAAKEFKVKENQIEEWARVLEEHDLIEIHYPAFGKPLMKRKNV